MKTELIAPSDYEHFIDVIREGSEEFGILWIAANMAAAGALDRYGQRSDYRALASDVTLAILRSLYKPIPELTPASKQGEEA